MRSRRLLILWYVGPLALWMAFIFAMSTDIGSPQNSQGLLERVLHFLSPSFLKSLSQYQIHRVDYALRKLGHFTEYMVLTLLAVRVLQFGRPKLKLSSFLGAMALSVGFALSDEFHQRFVESRTPSMRDVLIDSAGSAVCMIGILARFWIKGVERRLQDRATAESDLVGQADDVQIDGARQALS